MNNHTPGPWTGIEDEGVYSGPDNGVIVFETGCGCCTDTTLRQPDADLIAAAPDMLEALIDCRRTLELANFTQELVVVNAAIAKATGQNT